MFQVHRGKKSAALAVQPNVMKKSWTTPNVADESFTQSCSEEPSAFRSRDLIREYLLKTRVPEILKLSESRRHSETFVTSAMTSEMNFAYKHPLVIAEELKNGGSEALDGFGRKLLSDVDNSSIIIPKAIRQPKKISHDERPHLIGKVTPNIAKTWEQLTNAMDSSINSQTEEDDKQSYVLFVRKPFNFQASDEDVFAVNKIHHPASEKFFDSIDNDTRYADEYDEESGTEGGEVMAEGIDSLELRCHDVILWSIES